MELLISGKTTIEELNKMVQRSYPYLKLEFFQNQPEPGGTLGEEKRINPGTKLGEITGNFLSTIIDLKPTDTVSEVEYKFQKELGLFVKVYRIENNRWRMEMGCNFLGQDKRNLSITEGFKLNDNVYSLYL